jgi:proline iminopeptidase
MDYLLPDLAPLAARHTLIAYDQRGSGRSIAPHDAAHINIDKHLADLDAVRVNFGLARLSLVGHSWGGRLAAIYAATHSERVARLLLDDPGPPQTDPRFARNLVAWADSTSLDRIARLRQAASSAGGDRLGTCRAFWNVFIRGYWADPNDTTSMRRMRGDLCAYPTAMADMDQVGPLTITSIGSRDYTPELRGVRAPVLIVAGGNSPMPLDNHRAWALAFPNARLLVIDHAGHFPHVEQPRAFFDAAETFLRGDWPAAALTARHSP